MKPFALSLSKGLSALAVVRPFSKLKTGQAHHERLCFTLSEKLAKWAVLRCRLPPQPLVLV